MGSNILITSFECLKYLVVIDFLECSALKYYIAKVCELDTFNKLFDYYCLTFVTLSSRYVMVNYLVCIRVCFAQLLKLS